MAAVFIDGQLRVSSARALVAVLCCCLPSLVLALPQLDLDATGAGELTLTSEEQAYLQAKSRITYCPDPAWMPLEAIQDGVHLGMTRDYVDYVQGMLGVPFELVVSASWSEAIEHARNRVCDVWPLAMPTPERLTYMRCCCGAIILSCSWWMWTMWPMVWSVWREGICLA